MKEITKAQVHRHAGRIALWLEGQPTVYLTVHQARGLAAALKGCAKDICENTEAKSKFSTFRILP
jgi:hypothetical protein